MRAAYHNLGCKVNSYELDLIRNEMESFGFISVPFDSSADIYIVNTCTVTSIADHKSRQFLHRARQLNPDGIVVAVGCYVDTSSRELVADGTIDVCISNKEKDKAVLTILKELEIKGFSLPDSTAKNNCAANDVHRTRAFIKIQDGCDNFCSYCIIPYARGRVRSRSQIDILTEVRQIASAGFKEIVITGIHISSYGKDFTSAIFFNNNDFTGSYDSIDSECANDTYFSVSDGVCDNRDSFYSSESLKSSDIAFIADNSPSKSCDKYNIHLVNLLSAINQITEIQRIRLGSLEPGLITEEFVKHIVGLDKLCHHFHLSLQSGCDTVLSRMNRHYSTDDFRHSVKLLRDAFSHPAITTDIITGFPGESDDEFRQTLSFADEIGFADIHVFPYSRRHGTRAATMPGQLTEKVKKSRANELIAKVSTLHKDFLSHYVGKEVEVLWEQVSILGGQTPLDGGQTLGGQTPLDHLRLHTCIEGITREYCRVFAPVSDSNQTFLPGTISMVLIDGIFEKGLIATIPTSLTGGQTSNIQV